MNKPNIKIKAQINDLNFLEEFYHNQLSLYFKFYFNQKPGLPVEVIHDLYLPLLREMEERYESVKEATCRLVLHTPATVNIVPFKINRFETLIILKGWEQSLKDYNNLSDIEKLENEDCGWTLKMLKDKIKAAEERYLNAFTTEERLDITLETYRTIYSC